jgi:integrase/recombinase XerD
MTATGLRVSELCGLRVRQVDLSVGQIRVLGKGARERVVIITSGEIRELIRKYLEARSTVREPEASLLINARGRPVTPQYLRQQLRALSKKAGLSRHVTPHMLRHTAATLLIEGGVDIRYVQRLLGHASIATTQIYTHVSDVALRVALERANVMQTFVF